jgi:hypothetical protein
MRWEHIDMSGKSKYIYCFIKENERINICGASFENKISPVYTVPFKDISAVVSDTDITEFYPTRKNALAHQRAVNAVMEKYPILPVAFGTVSNSKEEIEEIIKLNYDEFLEKLDYFKDAAGGNKCNVSISQSGKMAILQISTNLLENSYDYPFETELKGILPVPIGYTVDGLKILDLAAHEHVLIGGETGSGKTTALTVIITALRGLKEPPILIIIDLKKSGDYSYLGDDVLLITDRETAGQALDRLM